MNDVLDALANNILFIVDPYRLAQYLDQNGCHDEAEWLASGLSRRGPLTNRAWAYGIWSNVLFEDGKFDEASAKADAAIYYDSRPAYPFEERAKIETIEGKWQLAADDLEQVVSRLQVWVQHGAPRFVNASLAIERAAVARLKSASGEAASHYREAENVYVDQDVAAIDAPMAADLAFAHELEAASTVLAGMPDDQRDTATLMKFAQWHEPFFPPHVAVAVNAERWDLAAALLRHYVTTDPQDPETRLFYDKYGAIFLEPWLALANAKLGNMTEARRWLDGTGSAERDCELCYRMRGRVLAALVVDEQKAGDADALQRDYKAAEAEFADAIRAAPTLAFARYYRGLMRVLSGGPGARAGAAEDLQAANSLASNWADPLETWGELLVREGKEREAIEKFSAAIGEAPRWSKPVRFRAQAFRGIHWNAAYMHDNQTAMKLQRGENEAVALTQSTPVNSSNPWRQQHAQMNCKAALLRIRNSGQD